MRKRHGCGSFILILLLLCALFLGGRYAVRRVFPVRYRQTVTAVCTTYDVDPALVYALIKAESNFNENAVSAKGAKGLMQLMDSTAQWCAKDGNIALSDILDPRQNITIGTYYLSYLLDMYHGNIETAVAAYNAGHGRVDEWLCDRQYSPDGEMLTTIPFAETDKYRKKINFYREVYELLLK